MKRLHWACTNPKCPHTTTSLPYTTDMWHHYTPNARNATRMRQVQPPAKDE